MPSTVVRSAAGKATEVWTTAGSVSREGRLAVTSCSSGGATKPKSAPAVMPEPTPFVTRVRPIAT